MANQRPNRDDPFQSKSSIEQAADAIYGESDLIPESGRLVARPIAIADIHADIKQPRRAIPAILRGEWDGDAGNVPDLLEHWRLVATEWNRGPINTANIINGDGGYGYELDSVPPFVEQYVTLCRLAADIKKVGLINPIRIVKQHGLWIIESGERRWLAYHLLSHYDDVEKWSRIPAIESDGKDFVWRQATENTARRDLNAIGMARQFALLVMEARSNGNDDEYDAYHDLILPGEIDRRFYAQVANGNLHRIPKGYAERIQAAMALSDKQLSRYRNLLKLTDDDEVNDLIWERADIEDWAEGFMRELATSPIGEVREVLSDENWTLDDLRDLIEQEKYAKAVQSSPVPTKPQGRDTAEWSDERPMTDEEFEALKEAQRAQQASPQHDEPTARFTAADIDVKEEIKALLDDDYPVHESPEETTSDNAYSHTPDTTQIFRPGSDTREALIKLHSFLQATGHYDVASLVDAIATTTVTQAQDIAQGTHPYDPNPILAATTDAVYTLFGEIGEAIDREGTTT